jgi:hypothetical protein
MFIMCLRISERYGLVMSLSVVYVGPHLFVRSYKLPQVCDCYYILVTIFICTITLLSITRVTAHHNAWRLQPDNLVSHPSQATSLPELEHFYGVFRT